MIKLSGFTRFFIFLLLSGCSLSPARQFLAPDQKAWSVNAVLLRLKESSEALEQAPGVAFTWQSGWTPDLNGGISFSLWPGGQFILLISPYLSLQSISHTQGWSLRHALQYEFLMSASWRSSFMRGPFYIHRLTLSTVPVWSSTAISWYLPLDTSLVLNSHQTSFMFMGGWGLTTLQAWRFNAEINLGGIWSSAQADRLTALRLGLTRVYTP